MRDEAILGGVTDDAAHPEETREPLPAETPETPLPAEAAGEGQDLLFETLWKRVLEAWDDDKTHGALLEYAIRGGHLPDAAGRYRALKEDPERAKRAQKQLDAIVLSATQMMLSMKTPTRTKVPLSITLSAFGVCAALLGLLAYALFHH